MYANETLTNLILLANNEYLNIPEFTTARLCLEHHDKILNCSYKHFLEETLIPSSAMKKLLKLMEIQNYSDFKSSIQLFENMRYKQIKERYTQDAINQMNMKLRKSDLQAFASTIESLTSKIEECNRIIIIARKELFGFFVDFQLDMLLMGKTVLVYPTQIELNIPIQEKDLVIFFSLTGRSMNYFQNIYKTLKERQCYSIIVTMAKELQQFYDDIIYIETTTDDFECNYLIRLYFDNIRYAYYQQKRLENVIE